MLTEVSVLPSPIVIQSQRDTHRSTLIINRLPYQLRKKKKTKQKSEIQNFCFEKEKKEGGGKGKYCGTCTL